MATIKYALIQAEDPEERLKKLRREREDVEDRIERAGERREEATADEARPHKQLERIKIHIAQAER